MRACILLTKLIPPWAGRAKEDVRSLLCRDSFCERSRAKEDPDRKGGEIHFASAVEQKKIPTVREERFILRAQNNKRQKINDEQ